ncbi:MAG: 5'-methylthioadenosine/adenosylhomocysteine nucleosidase [Clostridiales bacterium]|jgi:adenosylhomocysteine nucleosidase|nr:5'-methylthioadenosine/adenosylhomocysteine nucleosidase [Clostridiales bacterium]
MKTIGIIGAMEEEIAVLKSKMELISTKNVIGADFYLGTMAGCSIILARCGIGKVNAAVCAQVLIDLYAVDYCINIGVAGALNKELSIGDIVISRDAVHHDFDTTPFGDPIGLIPRLNARFFAADEELVRIAETCAKTVMKDKNIVIGRIASGDQFIADNEAKTKIAGITKADCVEMEGAAIAQACFLNRIPFVIIRAISDKADHSAEGNFEKFVAEAANNSGWIVEEMVKIL